MDRVRNLQKAPRLRRPSITEGKLNGDDDGMRFRRSIQIRNSRSGAAPRVSTLVAPPGGRRISTYKDEEDDKVPQLQSKQTGGMSETPKDYARILSIPYMVNFDQIFITAYPLKEATLSSIELIKQEIAEKFERSDRKYSQSDLSKGDLERLAEIENFKNLRRQKLLSDVWNKQHRYRRSFSSLHEEMSKKWLEEANKAIDANDADRTLSAVEKYLFYNPGVSSAFIMKSFAFQIEGNLPMASIAIKMAQKIGLSAEEEAGLQEKLARFEYNQAEKFREMGDLKQAVVKYAAAHEIIPNFEDTPVRIINLEFEMGNTKKATILLDEQIKAQPERLELRVRRTAQLLKMNRLDEVLDHLEYISEIDPQNSEMLRMRQELEDRGVRHENHCLMHIAANHMKDALLQVELALAARPKLLRLYFLRARIYRRLKLWERALADVEMLFSADVPELKDQCQNLIFCILNDFGVDCIKQGSYSEAILLFNAVLMHIKGERKVFLNRGDCWLRLGNSEKALRDYNRALGLCMHEPTCRLIRGRISVVHHEFGSKAYRQGFYKEAEHHFSLALQYQVLPLYLIHRARARIMIGLDSQAKLDALTAYKIEPKSPELVPVLARLFPDANIPEVESYQQRFFPEINPNQKNKQILPKPAVNLPQPDVEEVQALKKKKEVVSLGEMRTALIQQYSPIKPLPPIKTSQDVQGELKKQSGWHQFNIGISQK